MFFLVFVCVILIHFSFSHPIAVWSEFHFKATVTVICILYQKDSKDSWVTSCMIVEAMYLQLVLQQRPSLHVMVEQPSSSWAFKMLFMVALASTWQLFTACVWMGHYGHDLLKCSHLLSNLRSLVVCSILISPVMEKCKVIQVCSCIL